MNKFRSKTCTHCGSETHGQPQDPNHDNGYGHCYGCLETIGCYKKSHREIAPDIRLEIWEMLDRTNGVLTKDDSHGKVIEVLVDGKVIKHFTSYLKKHVIENWANNTIGKFRESANN